MRDPRRDDQRLPSRPARSGRREVAGLALAGGALALAAQRGTWVSGTVDVALLGAGAGGPARVDVDGATASPGVGAVALVVLAAAAASALAGARSGRLLGVILILSGAGLAALAGSVWLRPQAVVAAEGGRLAAVTAVTVTDVQRGAALALTALAGAAALAAGLSALRSAGAWARTSTRYQRDQRDPLPPNGSGPTAGMVPPDAQSVWDALDRGEDPTRRAQTPGGRPPAAATGEDLPE